MNYDYGNDSAKKLIRNYKISDNKLLITFLDGSKYLIPFTTENETSILHIMLKQAEDRNQSSLLNDTKLKKLMHLVTAIGSFQIAVCGLLSSTDIENLTIAILGSSSLMMSLASYNLENKKYKELKKYDLYLSIKKQLENTNKSYLYNNFIDNQININTLDKYSIKDIKILQKKLTTLNNKHNNVFIKKTNK